ncbi:MAG TPA: NAD(P)-dependent oxidoreductase [Vicinamibacterales bacterium]|nr:NAD(P)-dependent oxidoreductase [Vicinamibacterales bacterium]
MKVLIVGAAGQLGQEMAARLRREHDVTAWTRQDIDLTRHQDVREAVNELAPEAIVNCASFNQVDASEDEQVTAIDVNAMVVGTLAGVAAQLDAVLMHYSTDFVFAGTSNTPYTEVDKPEPRSVYAQSKLIGEWLAADAPKQYVLRVESLFGGPHRRSSVDRIVDQVRSGQPAPVFSDRVVSPSFVADVADASAFILRTMPPPGLYHCVNSGHATWLEVGREIVKRLGESETLLKPISVDDVKLKAVRPQFAALSNAKLAIAGYKMPTWQDAIGRYISLLRPQSSLSQGENGGLTPVPK